MDLEKLRPLVQRAAQDEGMSLDRLDLSPDGSQVIVADQSGTAAFPTSQLGDLGGEGAYRQVQRAYAERTYYTIGEQEFLDAEALDRAELAARRPGLGHLGANDAPPAATARQDRTLEALDRELRDE